MYLFLLGRDYYLSKLELIIYLKNNHPNYSIVFDDNKFLLIDFKQKPNFKKMFKKLAGLIRVSKLFYKSEKLDEQFLNYLDFLPSKKFNYAVSTINLNNSEKQDIYNYLKKEFKPYKAVLKKPKHHKNKQNDLIAPQNYFSYKLELEILSLYLKNYYYFFKTIEVYDPKELIYLDKNRPKRKDLHSTSLRLSRMMINLLDLKEHKKVYDPFCGTGTFIMNALYLNYNAVGMDKDKEMVEISRENAKWIKNRFNLNNDFNIIHSDNRKLVVKADGVVFEPYMGEFIDKLPNKLKSRQIVNYLENLYSLVFENLSKGLKKGARVVCILPEIKSYDEKLFNINLNVYRKNNFKEVNVKSIEPNLDLKNQIFYQTPKGSKLNRYIFILEKK